MMTKNERQIIGTNKWWTAAHYGSSRNMFGTLNHITGFGKTYETVKYIIAPYLLGFTETESRETFKVLILTPLSSLCEQWKNTLLELIPDVDMSKVEITTVQEFSNRFPIHQPGIIYVGLLIIDELHYFYGGTDAEVFYKYANNEKIRPLNGMLGLTATPTFRDGRHKEVLAIVPVIDTVGEEEAKENGWIPITYEYNLGVEMTIEEHNTYVECCNIMDKYGALLGDHPFHNAQKIIGGGYSQGQFYKGFSFALFWAKANGWSANCSAEVNSIWNPHTITGYAREYMKATNKRLRTVDNVKAKLDTALDIIVKMDLPTITFSGNTEMADLITAACKEKGIPAASYHSNLESAPMYDPVTNDFIRIKTGSNKGAIKMFSGKKVREQALDDLRAGRIKVINTVDAASAGLDVPNLRLAIILARKSSDNTQKQRTGRVKRFDPLDTNSNMVVVNLYVPGTRDEQFLQQAQRSKKGRRIYSVDEITVDKIESFKI